MEFNVNNIGKLVGAGEIAKTQNVAEPDKLNSVFAGGVRNKVVQNTPFDASEQHILGIFANAQNSVLIEE